MSVNIRKQASLYGKLRDFEWEIDFFSSVENQSKWEWINIGKFYETETDHLIELDCPDYF